MLLTRALQNSCSSFRSQKKVSFSVRRFPCLLKRFNTRRKLASCLVTNAALSPNSLYLSWFLALCSGRSHLVQTCFCVQITPIGRDDLYYRQLSIRPSIMMVQALIMLGLKLWVAASVRRPWYSLVQLAIMSLVQHIGTRWKVFRFL